MFDWTWYWQIPNVKGLGSGLGPKNLDLDIPTLKAYLMAGTHSVDYCSTSVTLSN